MSLRTSNLVTLAAFLAVPCAAQEPLDTATAETLNAAIAALQREDYDAARGLVARLERESLNPFERSRIEQVLFNLAFRERRYDEARGHLQRAIDVGGLSDQEIVQARYQRAQLLMAEERWPEGIAALEEWFAMAPRPNASAYYLLAVGYYQADDFEKALTAARTAIERMEQPQESWLSMLAALHLRQERYQDAVPVLNQLIAVAPDKKSYWLQLSSIYGRLEQYADALAIMQVAYNAGLLTESAEINRLADLLLFNELPARAAEVLEESMAANRVARDEPTYAKLASSWLAAAEFDKAIEPLERAVELAATGAPFVRLGQVHIQRGDWAQAEAALGRAIVKGSLNDAAEVQFLLGVCLYEQGRNDEARSWFEQARTAPRHREIANQYIEHIANQGHPQTRL